MSSAANNKKLDIVTQHASGGEVVGAAFIIGNVGATTNSGRAVTPRPPPFPPSKALRVARRGRSTDPTVLPPWPATTIVMRRPATPVRSF
jgi:hypothetical protein